MVLKYKKIALTSEGNGYIITGIKDKSLTYLYIPTQYNGFAVVAIGDSAFEGCSELESIAIPNSVTSIGEKAFYGFSKDQTIIVNGGKAATERWDKNWNKGCRAKIVYE